jgi:hypothetical protein
MDPSPAAFAFAPAGGAALPRSGAETEFDAAFRDGAVGAAIFIGSTFGCRAFTTIGARLLDLLFAARLLEPCELEFPGEGLFGCREFNVCEAGPLAGVGCGVGAVAFGVAGFDVALPTPAPETAPEALAVELPACVFAYQKYDPAPAATTIAAATRIILFFPERLRSAAFAESS